MTNIIKKYNFVVPIGYVCNVTSFIIQLHKRDAAYHDLHHKLLTCNYGKRFAIFDKLFGTYQRGVDYYSTSNLV